MLFKKRKKNRENYFKRKNPIVRNALSRGGNDEQHDSIFKSLLFY